MKRSDGGDTGMNPAMRTYAAFVLNAAIDSGKYADLSVEELESHVDAGTAFDFLERRLDKAYHLPFLSAEERQALSEEWASFSNAIDARRKFGIGRTGLCLLVAYLVEGIQQQMKALMDRNAQFESENRRN